MSTFFLLIAFTGMLNFMFNYMHFLNSLLSLEYIMLGLFMGIMFLLYHFGNFMLFAIFYIIMLVIESALGMSLLVFMTYAQGTEKLTSCNNSMC